MTNTQPTLRDLLTIRDYLRDRVDELIEAKLMSDANVIAYEISWINKAIAEAEAEAKP